MARVFLSLILITGSLLISFVPEAKAQFDHELIRRLVVFPMKVPGDFESFADEAWWQARDELTRSRRFLVASRQFLIKSDVFQPRADLSPADAIILGKLLDSHALMTFQLQGQQGRELTLSVFDGGNGTILYRKTIGLHPSLTVGDQLGSLSRRLVNDFIATIPYQGYTVVDALLGKAVYNEGGAKHTRIALSATNEVRVGDAVQWIRVSPAGAAPLFQGGATVQAIAEGKVIKIEDGIATAEILRVSDLKDIKEYALVRLPREAERLRSSFAITETPLTTLGPELIAPEAAPMKAIVQERKPLVATLSWVGSMAAFLLLAF